MIGALAVLVAIVQPGNTLSGIASANSISLAAVEAANPAVNPGHLYPGEEIVIPAPGGMAGGMPAQQAPAAARTLKGPAVAPASVSPGDITSIPGVPQSFVACVAYRESSNGANQAYNGGVYGIITASGYNVNGQSLAAQKAAFLAIYDTTGPSAWAADGCPGT